MGIWRPWPYAATAIVQHNWVVNVLFMWVTFRHPMDTTVKPAHDLWITNIDGVQKTIGFSAWQDEFTILILALNVLSDPNLAYLEYDGPNENLRTTWDKQWEPWGLILSFKASGSPFTSTKTVSAVGPTDNVDVGGIGILFLDCSANNVTIGGFINGIEGQVMQIARLCATGNNATLEHNEGTGNQDIFLHAGADEVLTGEFGGWTLVCNGSHWYDVSHSKHV